MKAVLKVLQSQVSDKKRKTSADREEYHRLIEGNSPAGPQWARCGMTQNEINREREEQMFKKKVLKAKQQ